MFTANPVTGTRHQTVIDASPGLGEAVVSGAVNPDHFVVDTSSGAIVERRLGDKRVVIASVAGRRHRGASTLDDRSDAACLTDDQVRALVDSAAGCKITTARRRTPSGRSTMTGGLADPGPADHHAVPAAGPATSRASPDLHVPDPGPGAHPADHADGAGQLPADRLLRRPRPPGRPPADRRAGPHADAARPGSGLFLDITPVVSNALRPAPGASRSFGVMEARASAVLRSPGRRPALPDPTRRSPLAIAGAGRSRWRCCGPRCRCGSLRRWSARARRPGSIARVGAPAARSSISLPAERDARASGWTRSRTALGTELFLLMPTVFAYAAAGLLLLPDWRAGCSATWPSLASCRRCCAACRTT